MKKQKTMMLLFQQQLALPVPRHGLPGQVVVVAGDGKGGAAVLEQLAIVPVDGGIAEGNQDKRSF